MIRALVLACSLGSPLGGAACTDGRSPELDAVTPAAAPLGALVTLTGRRLCGETGDCGTAGGEIQIGLSPPSVLAMIVEYEDTRAVIRIPELTPVGETDLLVTVNERASNALGFEVLP